MAQRLLKLEATFIDTEDSNLPTVWQHNGCPFVVTKRKTKTELTFTSVGVPDNSMFSVEERTGLFSVEERTRLFSVEERTGLFSELEESLTGDVLHTQLPYGETSFSVLAHTTLFRRVCLLLVLPPLSHCLLALPHLALHEQAKSHAGS